MDFIKRLFKEWIGPIIIALVIALTINKFIVFMVTVPTESMFPTIKPGDRIFSTRIHNKDNMKRGDIIVFFSKELDKTLVKRLIGLPGDEINIMADGSVYVNGEKTDEPYAVEDRGFEKGFKVPENEYFFLGDNRPNSYDSRYWDDPYIEENEIKGRSALIVFPFNRIGFFERYDY